MRMTCHFKATMWISMSDMRSAFCNYGVWPCVCLHSFSSINRCRFVAYSPAPPPFTHDLSSFHANYETPKHVCREHASTLQNIMFFCPTSHLAGNTNVMANWLHWKWPQLLSFCVHLFAIALCLHLMHKYIIVYVLRFPRQKPILNEYTARICTGGKNGLSELLAWIVYGVNMNVMLHLQHSIR